MSNIFIYGHLASKKEKPMVSLLDPGVLLNSIALGWKQPLMLKKWAQ